MKAMKESRLANHDSYIKNLPYMSIYEQYQGRPPLFPHSPLYPHNIQQLRQQIHDADCELRRNIDADWKSCVIQYPEVLNHYYSMVTVTKPQNVSPPTNVIMPSAPSILPRSNPPSSGNAIAAPARSTISATPNPQKKVRRNSKASNSRASIHGEDNMDAIAKMLQSHSIHGNSSLANAGVHRASSKAGRATPGVDQVPPMRSSGKKRSSKDYYSNSGRMTAPPQGMGFAPPAVPVPPAGSGPGGHSGHGWGGSIGTRYG